MNERQYRPAAVCDVQIADLHLPVLGLDGYERAFVVFRYGRAVVGQAWLPVTDGRLAVADLRSVEHALAPAIWQAKIAPPEPVAQALPTASVVVCTRDRPEDMVRCLPGLAHLAAQGHDVIVIDNAPTTDATRDLVAQYPQVRYVREVRPGANTARNRGLREARGEVIAFTDDDAIIDPDWLAALLVEFRDPVVALVTGITMPLELETSAQVCFQETNGFGRGFLRRTFDLDTIDPLAAGLVGASVNMAVRRAALRQIGLFDEALDGGTPTRSGGDHEFFYRVLARGFRTVYTPAALVWHRHRRDWASLERCIEGYGVGLFAWWTRAFLVENEWHVLKIGTSWFLEHHVGEACRALMRRPGAVPARLALAELRGALAGPGSYLRSRRQARAAATP